MADRLTLDRVEELTADAVAVTFSVPEHLRASYAWSPGQHVAVSVAGDDVRRSYSLCPSPEGTLRIGVRRLPGGRFSDRALRALTPGDPVEVMPPAGRFGSALPGLRRPAFVVAGSGITPVLSMVAAALADPAVDAVSVVVGNQRQDTVMFADELADLKDTDPARLQVVHVLSREHQESPLLSGRLDADRVRAIRDRLLGEAPDGWFLCGPHALVVDVRDALVADGCPPERVHLELFHADPGAAGVARIAPVPAPAGGTTATVTLGGRVSEARVEAGESVLDAVLRVRRDAPFACKGGVCGTCRARVDTGSTVMDASWALEKDEIERGYVLTCQAHPTSERLAIDYDA